jgi:hypothetical protein
MQSPENDGEREPQLLKAQTLPNAYFIAPKRLSQHDRSEAV